MRHLSYNFLIFDIRYFINSKLNLIEVKTVWNRPKSEALLYINNLENIVCNRFYIVYLEI